MTTYTKQKLSGATNGRGIKVATLGTPGTLIHTTVDADGQMNELWIYATNSSGGVVSLTLEFGGVTDPDDLIELELASKLGLTLVVPGLLLDGGVLVRAFASVADVITIFGYVHHLS